MIVPGSIRSSIKLTRAQARNHAAWSLGRESDVSCCLTDASHQTIDLSDDARPDPSQGVFRRNQPSRTILSRGKPLRVGFELVLRPPIETAAVAGQPAP